jgi:prepilin-type N-terminal cleavage/methylation domain-containing protein
MFVMPRRRGARSAGFTLVEMLVVIAIIGILVGLMLPAVQAARESGRRIACANNLHQIGLGLHAFHDTHGSFPPGGIERRSARYPKGRQLAWSAYLLPFIEQQDVYDRIDFRKAFDSEENAAAAATVISTYLCPSAARPTYLVDGRGACDYGGIYGQRIFGRNDPPKGAMIYDRRITIRDIIDGTAYTLIVSEDSGFHDGQWINALNVFDQAFAINQAPAFENDIRSKHPGGAMGLFCDAAVRFLPEMMDLTTLAAICTRNGREVIASDLFQQ